MRNLSLASTNLLKIEDVDEFETVVGTTFDVDNDVLITVSEIPSDAETSFQVWRMNTNTPEPYTHARRVLRVYDRSGRLQNTSEPVPGLEQGLAWKPSGSIIVSSQRFGFPGGGQGLQNRHDVVFFERNGLRHGEFGLREYWVPKPDTKRQWSYRVKEFAWNADSTILAVWVERDDGDAVQLWTTGNWHWYLKQEIPAPSPEDGSTPRFTAIDWHPEQPLRIVTTSPAHIDDYCFMWDTCTSTRAPPDDTGTVAVVDGAALLMTPFRLQVRPPPESSYKIVRPPPRIDPPIHVSQAPNADAIICLFPNARVEIWWLQTAKSVSRIPGDPDIAEPSLIWKGEIPGDLGARQALLWNSDDASEEWFIALLGIPEDGKHDVVSVTTWRAGEITEDYEVTMPSIGHGRIFFLEGCKLAWEGIDGEVTRVDFENEVATPLATLPEYCPRIQSVARSPKDWVICGLSETGKLHVVSTNGAKATLSTG
ncbi:hypothetical protein FS837_011810, partial [Tulasnella sp. UAMH 9824]